MHLVKILIFGSCVTRDAFEYIDKNRFSLVGYFARSSLGSAYTGKEVKSLNLDSISSSFQRSVVEADLYKNLNHL